MLSFFRKLFPSKRERDVQSLYPVVAEITKHSAALEQLSDEELKAKTTEFRGRISESTKELTGEIARVKTELAGELTFEQREALYDELDALNKQLDEKIEEVLDELLPEAFAVVKDACRRLDGRTWDVAGNKVQWDMVPFDVQHMGGAALHQGKIAEMATGEGKTLVATLPIYLNALYHYHLEDRKYV